VATTLTHRAAMRATRPGQREAELLGSMLAEMTACGMEPAYSPILTVHGEILHNETHANTLWPTDLVLADVGAETPEGWASDVTRTWPTTGRFSASQRAMYEVVLEAQKAAIEAVRPGVRFRDVHEIASRRLLEGLIDLRILRGNLDALHERGAHTLFFFHGIGHLIGLDVHDLEDLGDRAGYAPGRVRSSRFGDAYLRLDRDLSPGMAVTIEPGLYQVPAILEDQERLALFADVLCRDKLAAFADVRGIRIEDDVLVTPKGHRVLTEGIPKSIEEIESIVGQPA
jgi:Xaa-Pro aminopeptidase